MSFESYLDCPAVIPPDCKKWLELGATESGIYHINPSPNEGLLFQVLIKIKMLNKIFSTVGVL